MNIKSFLRSILSMTDYIDVDAAYQSVRNNVPFRGPTVYILFIAIIIASIGLNVNSIPVIIGAMLISPLMSPIIGFGLGLGANDRQLVLSSLKNLGIMVAISLLASTLYFVLTPLEVDNPTELLARTKPTIYDVMIALFGGLAGVMEISRKEKGTVLSGVAIATALMPPLCTVGYGLANLNWQNAVGALYLFFINSVFIALAAYITAQYLHFPKVQDTNGKHGHRVIMTTVLVLILIVPSVFTAYNVIRENNFSKNATRFIKKNQSIGKTYIYDYQVNTNQTPYTIDLRLAGESLTDETREMMYREAESVGLLRSQIIFHEDATIRFNELNETEIVKNLIATNEQNIRQRDDSIRILQTRLAQYEQRQLPSAQIATEIQSQLPAVQSVTLAKGARIASNAAEQDEVVVLIESKHPLSKEETTRVTNWLRVRLNTENIVLVNR